MSSSNTKLSREEFRRQKDLDAARKAGTAPAELDEEGNAINPHIPQFMAKAPWYLDTGKPSLKHQRKPDGDRTSHVKLGDWYQRGARKAEVATKYRKGACENCGAISHKTKDCLERPRKKGAKWTGKQIAADEVITEVAGLDKDYEAKRDRWNGYDPTDHKHVAQEYEAIEEARRKKREKQIDMQTTNSEVGTAKKAARKQIGNDDDDDDFGSSDSDHEDEDKYAERADMVGQKVDTDKRISVRNLRIREDRAKYLYNLDVDSAYYDPKSRSMREAPNAGVRPEDAQYAGDNFERSRGDTSKMQELQAFAWQSEARGNDIHMQADPTVNELQHREYEQKREKLNKQVKSSILDRYGGEEHFNSVPKELLAGQSDAYVEYTPAGQPIYNARRHLGIDHAATDAAEASKAITTTTTTTTTTKHDADKPKHYDGNHTQPYGSWIDPATGKAGYECCYSAVKNSYCTGQAGKDAQQASDLLNLTKASDSVKRIERERSRTRSFSSASSRSGSSSSYSDSDSDGRRRSDKRRRKHAKGYQSRKEVGEGAIDERLDRHKLKDALRHEHDKHTDGAQSNKPEWLKEAEQINARNKDKYRSLNGGGGDEFDVTEEQLEAYRMKNRNRIEDPMANYKDDEEEGNV